MDALLLALRKAEKAVDAGLHDAVDRYLDQFLHAEPYLPGETARPSDTFLPDILAAVASGPAQEHDNIEIAWAAGLRLFRRGYFWEAHECWEAVWLDLPTESASRFFLQAVIQHVNCELKSLMGREKAARRIASLAASHFQEASRRGFNPEGWRPSNRP